MFTTTKTFIPWEDRIVEVKRVYAEERVKNIELVKEWLGADTILRKDNQLYFCTSLQDAEIISEESA